MKSIVESVWPRQGIWQSFGLKHGLPDMKVEGLSVDADGVVWVGTHDKGVAYYDGACFTCLSRAEGLPGHGVYSIIPLQDGTVRLATDAGIASYGEGVLTANTRDQSAALWGHCTVDGRCYFGLDRREGMPPGIAVSTSPTSVAVVVLDDHPDAIEMSVTALAADPDGKIWCGGWTAASQAVIYTWDGYSSRQEVLPDGLGQIRTMCYRNDRGEIWGASDTGIFRSREGQIEYVDGPEVVQSMAQGSDGTLWAAGQDGNLYRAEDTRFELASSAGVPLWRGLAVDDEDRVWVGSYGFGLFCYDSSRVQIPIVVPGIANSPANAVVAQGSDIWVGVGSTLVHSCDGAMPSTPGGLSGLDEYDTTSMVIDSRGVIWVGRRNGEVYRVADGEAVPCETPPNVRGYSISDLEEDAEGQIWFCSRHSGVYGYFNKTGSVEVLSDREGPSRVACLASSLHGSMYLGVQRFSASDGVWEYTHDGEIQRVAGTQGVSANALLVDSRDRLWVGTSEGLLTLDNDFVVTYNTADGLPTDLVVCLFEDSRGVLWIGTEGGGAACFDGDVFQSVRLNGNTPLNSVVEVSEGAGNVMWFATNGGLVQRRRKRTPPSVALRTISADREHSPREGLQIPDTVGRVSFGFAAISPAVPSSELVFRYRLKGLSDDWSQTDDLEAGFTKLRPQGYTFELQSVDPDLNYSDVASFQFEVTEDPKIGALTAALSEDQRGEFIGQSAALDEVRRQIQEVGWTDLTVLILGETGTGKGIAARAVHELSERRNGPFIHVNCGALPDGLVDSELFGHEKGAFTGAVSRKLGKFELAEGGSIFLDEIGDLPTDSQTRLLRVLQDHCIERVGGTVTIPLDVRVIAATNRDLSEAAKRSEYRADLFYRLNVFPITIPPLRDRIEDVVDLAHHFSRSFAEHLNVKPPLISMGARTALEAYGWPGNVRELEHTTQRAVLLSRGSALTEEHLGLVAATGDSSAASGTILPLSEYERLYIERVLELTGGVIHGENGAAKLLGIKPTTLRSRMVKLGVNRP